MRQHPASSSEPVQRVGMPASFHCPAWWNGGTPESSGAVVILLFLSLYKRVSYRGRNEPEAVTVAIDHRIEDGTWVECLAPFEIAAMSKGRFTRTFTVPRPMDSVGQRWDIRVRRLTPDGRTWVKDRFYLQAVQEIFDGKRAA